MLVIERCIVLDDSVQEGYTCSKCGCRMGYRYKNTSTGEITSDDKLSNGKFWNYCMNCGSSLHYDEEYAYYE